MAPPNLRYINQSAPFWDWIANFEQSAADHPFFSGNSAGNTGAGAPGEDRSQHPPPPPHYPGNPPVAPWAAAWANAPWARSFAGWGQHAPPPPPPHYYDQQQGAEMTSGEEQSGDEKMKDGVEGEAVAEKGDKAVPDPPEETPGAAAAGPSDRESRRWGRHARRCERWERRHGPGGRGGHHGPHHPHGHHHGPPPPHMGRGGWGGPGRGGFGMLRELFGGFDGNNATNAAGSGDWKPEADVFDTEGAYVVHLSLPGAHKEDIGVTWDPEKSELAVAGVVHRPGDEAFLKTLALDERTTGAFERKVRLGTRAMPAHVDVEGITAKLENGILIVEVPKLNGEFVEVKKVDIE